MGIVDDNEGRADQLVGIYPSLRRFAAVVGSSDMSPDDLVHDAIVAVLKSDRLALVSGASAETSRRLKQSKEGERLNCEAGEDPEQVHPGQTLEQFPDVVDEGCSGPEP